MELKKKKYDKVELIVKKCYEALGTIKNNEIYDKKESKIYERNFVITFAFHLGQKISTDIFHENLFGGEVYKEVSKDEKVNKALSLLMKKDKDKEDKYEILRFIPDFVIHNSHNKEDNSSANQHVVIEVKTKKRLLTREFYWDLFKLILCINKLKYRNAIYIIDNTEMSRIENMITSYRCAIKYSLLPRRKRHLYFLIREPEQTSFELYELKYCAQMSR